MFSGQGSPSVEREFLDNSWGDLSSLLRTEEEEGILFWEAMSWEPWGASDHWWDHKMENQHSSLWLPFRWEGWVKRRYQGPAQGAPGGVLASLRIYCIRMEVASWRASPPRVPAPLGHLVHPGCWTWIPVPSSLDVHSFLVIWPSRGFLDDLCKLLPNAPFPISRT